VSKLCRQHQHEIRCRDAGTAVYHEGSFVSGSCGW
jgi:hypothetical protein